MGDKMGGLEVFEAFMLFYNKCFTLKIYNILHFYLFARRYLFIHTWDRVAYIFAHRYMGQGRVYLLI